jgi:dolichol kinase
MTHQPAVYAVALLHMSLADGLAAVVGDRYGHGSTYHIFGTKKSRLGTLTFLCVSLAILVAFSVQQGVSLGIWLPLIAAGATILENFAIRGLDNLLIPVFVALLLSAVH